MLDHISLQVSDVRASREFYEAVLGPIGLRPILELEDVVGFGDGNAMPFWLGPARAASGREVHVAFTATHRVSVHRFHEAALAVGAEVLHAPREWPEYHPSYYACFIRDLDGNNVEAVCHVPETLVRRG